LRTDTQNIYVAIGKEMLKFVMVRKSLFFEWSWVNLQSN
jgi:hypothetical protein